MNLIPRRDVDMGNAGLSDDRPPDVFELTASERNSPLWLKLKAELSKRLASKREENDGPLDAEATARVRGHLECLRSIISIGDEPPTLEE